jgi:hypothetical protein
MIAVREAGGAFWVVPGHRLAATLDALGGPEPAARGGRDGVLAYQAAAEARWATEERPFRFRGELLGFAEGMAAPVAGVLRITDDDLVFREMPGSGGLPAIARASAGGVPTPSTAVEGGALLHGWPLLGIGAVQTTSRSLQIAPRAGGLVQFRFPDDSPRRWEELLHLALRQAYRRAGRGEIGEFQPRIVAR